jgi:hypothetical protein
MIFVKSFLAGVAAVMMATLLVYGLALGVSRILERIPLGEGGNGAYVIGLFQCGRWWLWRFSSSAAASSAVSGETGTRERVRSNKTGVTVH